LFSVNFGLNKMELPVVWLVLGTPILIAPGLSFYFDVVPKAVVLLTGVSLLLLIGATTLIPVRRFATSRLGLPLTLALLVLIMSTIASMWLASDRAAAWNGSNWRKFGALEQIAILVAALLICAACAESEGIRKTVLRSVCVAGAISGTYCIFQYCHLDPILPTSAYQAGEGVFRIVRPPGTLGHSDYLGAWLPWSLFISVYLVTKSRNRTGKFLAILTVLIIATSLVLTGSRGALLGLFTGILCYCLLKRIRIRDASVALAAAAMILALFIVSPAGAQLRARAHWIGDDPLGGARPLLWRDSLTMALDHPLRGYGPDLFATEFPRYQSLELVRAFPNFYHESPHNVLLDMLTGSGLIGLFAFLLVFGVAVWSGIARRSQDADLSVALTSALAAVFVAQQFAVFTIATALYFYLGAGLLVGLTQRSADTALASKAVRISYAACSLIVGMMFMYTGVRIYLADRYLAVAKSDLDSDNVPGVVQPLRAAALLRNTGVTADLYFSRRWAVAATAARNPLERAQYAQFARNFAVDSTHSTNQRQNAWYNMALIAASANDVATTERSLRSAIEAAPKWYKPHWSLARVLFATGRIQEARAEASLALTFDAGKDAEVTSTMNELIRSDTVAKKVY
jgi:O-antigen ligase